jgi:hypothetical protein
MGDWKEWGECDVPCGVGTQVAKRQVNSLPNFGGETCGELKKERECDMGECKCAHVSCSLEINPACSRNEQTVLHGSHADDGDEMPVSCTVVRVHHHGLDFARKHHCFYNHVEDHCECGCPANQKQALLAIAEHRESNFENLRPGNRANPNAQKSAMGWHHGREYTSDLGNYRKTHRDGELLVEKDIRHHHLGHLNRDESVTGDKVSEGLL